MASIKEVVEIIVRVIVGSLIILSVVSVVKYMAELIKPPMTIDGIVFYGIITVIIVIKLGDWLKKVIGGENE